MRKHRHTTTAAITLWTTDQTTDESPTGRHTADTPTDLDSYAAGAHYNR